MKIRPQVQSVSTIQPPGLTVSLSAVRRNYTTLRDRVGPAACGAVVKANAYGLGVDVVAPALWAEGAREFFVATLDEGITLRGLLPQAIIYVLNGVLPGSEKEAASFSLIPVLNDTEALGRFTDGQNVAVHVDTGLNRLGFNRDVATKADFSKLKPGLILSHLACADTPSHPMNAQQLERFQQVRQIFPHTRASLAASDGIFCGTDYHADLVRPGAALYGLNPTPDLPNPMEQVVQLYVPILQIRTVEQDGIAGYGATAVVKKSQRLATVALGYADGLPRSLSNTGKLFHQGTALPIVGRVSMDVTIVDISALPQDSVHVGDTLMVFGPDQTPDALGRAAGTIGYEILTALGDRYKKHVVG